MYWSLHLQHCPGLKSRLLVALCWARSPDLPACDRVSSRQTHGLVLGSGAGLEVGSRAGFTVSKGSQNRPRKVCGELVTVR